MDNNTVYIVTEDFKRFDYANNNKNVSKQFVESYFFSSKKEATKYITETIFKDFDKIPYLVTSETGQKCITSTDPLLLSATVTVYTKNDDSISYEEQYQYGVVCLEKFNI